MIATTQLATTQLATTQLAKSVGAERGINTSVLWRLLTNTKLSLLTIRQVVIKPASEDRSWLVTSPNRYLGNRYSFV